MSGRRPSPYWLLLAVAGLLVAPGWVTTLAAGLVGSTVNGSGLSGGDSLRFRLVRAGSTLVDQTFTTNTAVSSYFANTAFNLGISNSGTGGGNLDVQFLFDLTSLSTNACQPPFPKFGSYGLPVERTI